jgi:hypothetical protein
VLEYAPSVVSTSVGQLVKVADGGAARDGVVFDLPSHLKVVWSPSSTLVVARYFARFIRRR